MCFLKFYSIIPILYVYILYIYILFIFYVYILIFKRHFVIIKAVMVVRCFEKWSLIVLVNIFIYFLSYFMNLQPTLFIDSLFPSHL